MATFYNHLAGLSVKHRSCAFLVRGSNRVSHGLKRSWPKPAVTWGKKEYRLPFDPNIPASTYLDNAIPFSILCHNPDAAALYFTYHAQLFFPHNKHSGSEKFTFSPALNRDHWTAAGLLTTEEVHDYRKGDKGPHELIGNILQWLAEGYYLEFRLNDYFIPGRTAYMLFNILRLNCIIGADAKEEYFWVAGSRDQDTYIVSKLHFKDFLSAFYDLPASRTLMPQAQIHWWKWIWKWRATDRSGAALPSTIDLPQLTAQISDFLEGRDSRINPNISIPNNVESHRTGAWGIDIFYAFRDYLEMVEKDSSPIDLRASRVLWEYQQCMLARLEHLEAQGVAIAESLTGGFTALEKVAAGIHQQARNYNGRKDPARLQSIQRDIGHIMKRMVPLMETLLASLKLS